MLFVPPCAAHLKRSTMNSRTAIAITILDLAAQSTAPRCHDIVSEFAERATAKFKSDNRDFEDSR